MANIPGHPNYLATIDGEIISRPRATTSGGKLKQVREKGGYLHVRTHKTIRVHKLMQLAFLPKGIINHIDCDKANNRLENLEVVTQRYNIQHARMNNRNPTGLEHSRKLRKPKGGVYNTLIPEKKVREVLLADDNSYRELEKTYGLSASSIKRLRQAEIIGLKIHKFLEPKKFIKLDNDKIVLWNPPCTSDYERKQNAND